LFVIHAGVVENGGGTAGEVEAEIGSAAGAILMLFVIVWMGGDAARWDGGGDGEDAFFLPTRGLIDLLALVDGGSLTTLFFPLRSSLSLSIDLCRFFGLDSSAAAPLFASPLPAPPFSSFSSPSPLTLASCCEIFIFDPSSFVSSLSCFCSTPWPSSATDARAFVRLRFLLLLSSSPRFFLNAGGELLAAAACSILSLSLSQSLISRSW
jgi:hypothetical protein